MTAQEIAQAVDGDPVDIFRLMFHFAANNDSVEMETKEPVYESTFKMA